MNSIDSKANILLAFFPEPCYHVTNDGIRGRSEETIRELVQSN